MGLTADINRSNLPGINPGSLQGVACSLDGKGYRVLIPGGNRLLEQLKAPLVARRIGAPDLGNLLNLYSSARYVRPIADYTNGHADLLSK